MKASSSNFQLDNSAARLRFFVMLSGILLFNLVIFQLGKADMGIAQGWVWAVAGLSLAFLAMAFTLYRLRGVSTTVMGVQAVFAVMAFRYIFVIRDIPTILAVQLLALSVFSFELLPSKTRRRWLSLISLLAIVIIIFDSTLGEQRIGSIQVFSQVIPWVILPLLLAIGIYVVSIFSQLALRTKLFVLATAASFLSIAMMALVTLTYSRNSRLEQIDQEMHGYVQLQADTLRLDIERKIDATALLSGVSSEMVKLFGINTSSDEGASKAAEWALADDSDPVITQIMTNELAKRLAAAKNTVPGLVDVYVTDANGALIASTTFDVPFEHREEAWYAVSEGTRAVVLDPPSTASETEQVIFRVIAPAHAVDAPDQRLGYLVAIYDLQSVSKILAMGTDFPTETGQTLVVMSENAILKNESESGLQMEPVSDELQNYLDGAGENEIDNLRYWAYEGVPSWYVDHPVESAAYPQISELNWKIVSAQNNVELLSPVRNLRILITGVAVLLAIATLAVSSWAGRVIASPIQTIADVANKFREGEMDARITIQSQDELGEVGNSFNRLGDQLRRTLNTLELRVQQRTQILETTSEVTRTLSAFLDERALINTLVKELRESFSYYNAYVFLMDDEMNRAVVVDGTGQVGQALTATRFSVGRSEGIVGSAIENRQVFLANDLNQEPRHIPNPLLPNAQSELVVPIVAGDKVLGAIDVQKTTINAFSQVDVDVLRALASQVGTGLQNARQIISARKVAEREALISRITERIRETKDLDSAMRTATVELGRIVKADKVAVRLNRKTEPEREQELSNVENEGSD